MSVPYVQIETISMSRLRNGELYTFVKRTIEDIPYDEEEDDEEEDGPQVQAVIRNLGKSASKINVSSELIERANEKLQALSYLTREGRASTRDIGQITQRKCHVYPKSCICGLHLARRSRADSRFADADEVEDVHRPEQTASV